jgi:phosphate uptake regulator
MKRKVVKQGPATMMVSLPSKWIKENKIAAGDELGVLPAGNRIIYSKSEQKTGRKEITVNIDNYWNHTALSKCLAVLYRTNYDKINLVHSKPIYLNRAANKVPLKVWASESINKFVGVEITSQSSTKTEIECLTTEENPNLEKMAKRISFLIKETTSELISSIGENYHTFHETVGIHLDSIGKFVNYLLRTLYASDKSEDLKRFEFAFYSYLEIMVDKIRHTSSQIDKFGCTPKLKKCLEEIFQVFNEQFEAIDKGEEFSQELMKKRYDLRQGILQEKFTPKESRIIAEAMPFLDTIALFAELSVVRNLEKNQSVGEGDISQSGDKVSINFTLSNNELP